MLSWRQENGAEQSKMWRVPGGGERSGPPGDRTLVGSSPAGSTARPVPGPGISAPRHSGANVPYALVFPASPSPRAHNSHAGAPKIPRFCLKSRDFISRSSRPKSRGVFTTRQAPQSPEMGFPIPIVIMGGPVDLPAGIPASAYHSSPVSKPFPAAACEKQAGLLTSVTNSRCVQRGRF